MKKRTKIIVLLITLLLLTGCTKTLKVKDKIITYDKTGQTLTSNILCKPEEDELKELYIKYDKYLQVKMKELPTCKSFTPNKIKYKSLWESLFVKPLGYIILKFGYLINNMAISVMVIGLLIRIVLIPVQTKSIKQSENMKKAQPELQKIEKKYAGRDDNEALMAKSQETMLLYKKYGVNPVSGCLLAFIQLPLFFAFLEALNRGPAIFEGNFLGMNLAMTPSTGIAQKKYIYIVLVILIILTTYLSFKKSMSSQSGQPPEMQQQMKMMFIFMIVMIAFASLSLPTAIALYWIVTNGFAIIQNIIVERKIGKKD